MPDLSFEQNINQSLQMHLSPRLLSMLKILSLPYVEIVSEIEKASEENPFIEIDKHDSLIEYIRYLKSDKKIRKEVDFKEYPGLENIKDIDKSLHTFLHDQIQMLKLDAIEDKIAMELISDIDSRGYLKDYEKLKNRLVGELNVSDSKIEEILEIVQTLDPEGVGARDLKECLLIQIEEFGFDNDELQKKLEEVVSGHLEALGNKDYKNIADALGITEEGVKEIKNFIEQNLNPYPGSLFGEEEHQITPSFSIEKEGDELKFVNLEEKYGPKIVLSEVYQKMLKSKKTDAETVKFLKDKLEKAKELFENLAKRGETSQAIMSIVMETQKDFIEKGAIHLLPLEQKALATRLGLHPSTISRAIAGKYVQTPAGLLPIKLLCPREFKGNTPVSIKARILNFITSEDKKNPLSDDQIKEMLMKEGVRIERRTVASYRKQLEILSSSERNVK